MNQPFDDMSPKRLLAMARLYNHDHCEQRQITKADAAWLQRRGWIEQRYVGYWHITVAGREYMANRKPRPLPTEFFEDGP